MQLTHVLLTDTYLDLFGYDKVYSLLLNNLTINAKLVIDFRLFSC